MSVENHAGGNQPHCIQIVGGRFEGMTGIKHVYVLLPRQSGFTIDLAGSRAKFGGYRH